MAIVILDGAANNRIAAQQLTVPVGRKLIGYSSSATNLASRTSTISRSVHLGHGDCKHQTGLSLRLLWSLAGLKDSIDATPTPRQPFQIVVSPYRVPSWPFLRALSEI